MKSCKYPVRPKASINHVISWLFCRKKPNLDTNADSKLTRSSAIRKQYLSAVLLKDVYSSRVNLSCNRFKLICWILILITFGNTCIILWIKGVCSLSVKHFLSARLGAIYFGKKLRYSCVEYKSIDEQNSVLAELTCLER